MEEEENLKKGKATIIKTTELRNTGTEGGLSILSSKI